MKLIQAPHLTDFRQIISYLQVLSLWILVALLPFRMGVIPRWAMIVAGVLYFIDYGVNKRWIGWRWTKDKWLYVIMIVYYLCIFIWNIGSHTHTSRFSFVLEERLPFVLCGMIGIMGLNKDVKLKHICYVMIVSAVVTSLYIIYHCDGCFFLQSPMKQSLLFTQSRIQWVNSHMMYNLYLNTTLIFAFYLLTREKISRAIRVLVVLACLWFFYLLCLTEGRVGIITGLILGASFILIYSYKRGLKWFVPILIGYAVLCTGIIAQHQRFTASKIEHEPRWMIWNANIDIIMEKPVIGHGVCDAKELLIEKAIVGDGELQRWYRNRINTVYNGNQNKIQPHNAFLEAWGEFGIVGLCLLFCIFLFPLTMHPKENRIYMLLIIGCFCIQSMFDSFFSPLLYSLAIIFFTSQSETLQANGSQTPDVV